MSKKHIIIAAAAGLLSFAGAFVVAWLVGGSAQVPPETTAEAQQATESAQAAVDTSESSETDDRRETIAGMTEKQLKNLVYEVREKIQDYESKTEELELREARLQMTQETLKKDIDELNRLRVEMAALVANLKEQRSQLLETRARIEESEKANLVAIAATYDKMDPAGASKILSNMCAKQMDEGRIVPGGPIDDTAKILFYMTERTKAKLLAEMVTSEPKLAAVLCRRLKEIVE